MDENVHRMTPMEELKLLLRGYADESRAILSFMQESKDRSDDRELLVKLDTRLTTVLEQMTKMLEDHERRLREEEKKSTTLVGWVAAAGACLSLGSWIFSIFFRKG